MQFPEIEDGYIEPHRLDIPALDPHQFRSSTSNTSEILVTVRLFKRLDILPTEAAFDTEMAGGDAVVVW